MASKTIVRAINGPTILSTKPKHKQFFPKLSYCYQPMLPRLSSPTGQKAFGSKHETPAVARLSHIMTLAR